jgi:hypothetical protein
MRKPMRAHIFRAIGCLSLIGFAGACTTPVAPEAARTPPSGTRAAQSTATGPDTTVPAPGDSGATVASDTVGRGGGFVGSGH